MVKCESLRINMFRITHTGKSVNFPVTNDDIVKLKERIFDGNSEHNSLIDIPHFFIQNIKVNDFNEKVHQAAKGKQYTIKSHDSGIRTISAELRDDYEADT